MKQERGARPRFVCRFWHRVMFQGPEVADRSVAGVDHPWKAIPSFVQELNATLQTVNGAPRRFHEWHRELGASLSSEFPFPFFSSCFVTASQP
jgi:hypothetical protein